MRDKHWTDEELLLRLLNSEPGDERLASCLVCTRRWEKIRSRYERRPSISADLSTERMAKQRAAVIARLHKRGKSRLMLAPSLAALALIVLLAFSFYKPRLSNQAVSEDGLLEDAFRMSLSIEPDAIEPVQSLFEEPQ